MDQQKKLKVHVIVEYHAGEKLLTKVWGFLGSHKCIRDKVEAEVLELFPHLVKK